MIDISKLANSSYKNYLISKCLCLALEKMVSDADPIEKNEVHLIKSLIDLEYPAYKAECAPDSSAAVSVLTKFAECKDVLEDGTRIYRSHPNEDIHGL
jgi:hypothetical protein